MITKNKDPRFSYMRRIAALFVLLASLGMVAFRSKNTKEISNVKSTADTIINPKKLFDSLECRNFDTMNAVYLLDKKQVSVAEIKNLTVDKVESASSWIEMRNGKYTTIIDVTLVDPKRLGSISLDKANPIYYVDGKEVTEKDFKSVNPKDIQSVYVWKGEKAIDKFGEKGKYGVIDVVTKNPGSIKEDNPLNPPVRDTAHKIIGIRFSSPTQGNGGDTGITTVRFDSATFVANDPKDTPTWPISNEPGKKRSPLYMIDGKEVTGIENINPNDIYSVTVLKDSTATAIFGEKGKNGVISIRMKKTASSLTP